MSTPSEIMLAAVTEAYQGALAGRVVQFEGRRYEPQDISALASELIRWRRIVSQEQAALAGRGTPARHSIAVFSDD